MVEIEKKIKRNLLSFFLRFSIQSIGFVWCVMSYFIEIIRKTGRISCHWEYSSSAGNRMSISSKCEKSFERANKNIKKKNENLFFKGTGEWGRKRVKILDKSCVELVKFFGEKNPRFFLISLKCVAHLMWTDSDFWSSVRFQFKSEKSQLRCKFEWNFPAHYSPCAERFRQKSIEGRLKYRKKKEEKKRFSRKRRPSCWTREENVKRKSSISSK